MVEFETHMVRNVNVQFHFCLSCFQTPSFLSLHKAPVSKLWNRKSVDLIIGFKVEGVLI